MKKLTAILLVLILLLGIATLIGCEEDETPSAHVDSEASSGVSATEPAPEIPSEHTLEGFVCTECGGSFFGRYRKIGNTEEVEEIEWIILKKEENRALVISKYALQERSFNQDGDAAYNESSIKEFLNGEFYNTAFSASQQKKILAEEGQDKIFLLSAAEAKEYFKSDDERKTAARWWLRDSGKDNGYAVYVNYDGEIDSYGYDVNYTLGFRPAMWVEL